MSEFEPLLTAINSSYGALTINCAMTLGTARPPDTPGVYALFFEDEIKYVGQASGRHGLRNRRNNYVSGDDSHTTHRVFLYDFPDKLNRRRHIEERVLMAWHCLDSGLLAKAVERALIWRLDPAWNRE